MRSLPAFAKTLRRGSPPTSFAGWTTRAAELRATVAELERGRDAEVGLAVAEQRNRLAGELHDTVAHAMTVICLQASAGQVSPEAARLDAILDTARSSLELLRTGDPSRPLFLPRSGASRDRFEEVRARWDVLRKAWLAAPAAPTLVTDAEAFVAIFAPVVTSWFGHRFLTFR